MSIVKTLTNEVHKFPDLVKNLTRDPLRGATIGAATIGATKASYERELREEWSYEKSWELQRKTGFVKNLTS